MREFLEDIGIDRAVHLTFDRPGPSGIVHAHRGHPLVRALAEHVAEAALSDAGEIASRCGALFTDVVSTRTALLILRLRSQIETQRTDGEAPCRLLAEECVVARLAGDRSVELLDDAESRRLLATPAARDMAPEQRKRMVEAAIGRLEQRDDDLAAIARTRAEALLADHTRVRDAAIGRSEARGYRIEVQPCLPVDVIGLYVLLPRL
jgi:hypothetical protein